MIRHICVGWHKKIIECISVTARFRSFTRCLWQPAFYAALPPCCRERLRGDAMKGKQMQFLQAMLEESTLTKAAERIGISRTTAYKYLKDKDFQKELNQRRGECINDTVRYLQGKLSLCNETLVSIIENPETSDQIKINAINAIYLNCKSMTETAEIITRLEQVEELIESGESR